MAWLSGWTKRIQLTIDKDLVDTALQVNFPVMVYLSAASGIGPVDVSAVFDELTADENRKKIAVTSSDGTTELYVEIEKWDDANEQAWLHVKVPSVAHDADTILYLYYDADHADNDTYVGDTIDAVTHNVWDSNFKGVWHMAQDPNEDGADAIKDSTSNQNDGTPTGTMLTGDLVDGKVGKAIVFDGLNDYIIVDDHASLDITGALTLEAIVKTTALESNSVGIVAKYFGSGDNRSYSLGYNGAEKLEVNLSVDGTSGSLETLVDDTAINDGNYYYGATVFVPSTSLTIFRDGSQTAQETVGIIAEIDSNTSNLWIGCQYSSAYPFNGIIDEVRISNTNRSAPWIKATYHSLWDTLITFGVEEETVSVSATHVSLIIAPKAATIIGATTVWAEAASLIITPQAATVGFGIPVSAKTASLIITPKNAAVKYDLNILCSLASLIVTTNAATISWDLDVSASSPALIATTHDAEIWDGAEWALWIAANGEKVVTKYYFTLTGDIVGDAEITNGNFEIGSPPSSWTEFDAPGVITVTRSSTKKYTDSYSLRIERTALAYWGTDGQGVYQDVAIDGGQGYSITGWLAVGTNPLDGVFGAVKLYEYAGEVSLGVVDLVAFNPSASWQKYDSGEITAGATATKVRIMLSTGPQYDPFTGYVYFDDFVLTNVVPEVKVDDIEIPISSFQCRRRDGSPTYLSVVIKDVDNYADEIVARSTGDMKIELAYELYGSEVNRAVLTTVDLEDIQIDEGGTSKSITLTGHRTISYTPKQITIRNLAHYRIKDGKYRYRSARPDPYLAPGDTVVADGSTFEVDQVSYIIGVDSQSMEITAEL